MPGDSNLEAIVFRVVAEWYGVPVNQVTRATRFDRDLGPDSIDWVDLLMTLEDALPAGGYDARVFDDLQKMPETIGELIDMLEGGEGDGVWARLRPRPSNGTGHGV